MTSGLKAPTTLGLGRADTEFELAERILISRALRLKSAVAPTRVAPSEWTDPESHTCNSLPVRPPSCQARCLKSKVSSSVVPTSRLPQNQNVEH